MDLHGAHDFRHTFATWLEDAGISTRVIDELMGHEAASRGGQQRGSAMGAQYRPITPEMAARVIEAIEVRLMVALEIAENVLRNARPQRERRSDKARHEQIPLSQSGRRKQITAGRGFAAARRGSELPGC